jgi:DNA modification methylase
VGEYAPIIGDETTDTAKASYERLKDMTDKQIIFGGNYFTDFLPFSDGWLVWDKRGDSGIRNNFADGEMAWCSFHTPVRIYHQLWCGMIKEDEHEKRVHPTQKPVKMIGDIMSDFTKEGDIVLDAFGGSGTTIIAAEQLGRKCRMMELDPHYCDVIIARWEKLTGQKAERIET